jgi:DNA-binding GntR family transcriptional regulator
MCHRGIPLRSQQRSYGDDGALDRLRSACVSEETMTDLLVFPTDLIDRASPRPIYTQIKDWMLGEIASGRWPVHYKLPAEEDLARALGVSRGTLRQAVQALIGERHLTQVQGKGTFVVSPTQIEEPLAEHLIAFSEELVLQGIPFRTEVLLQEIILPDQRIAAFLNLVPGEPVLRLQRRRFVDDVPIILTDNFVPLALAPGIECEDFTEQRLFSCLEQQYGLRLSWARRTFEAQSADQSVARLLALSPSAPLMYIEQIVYLEDGRSAECSDIWLRSDRFKVSSLISRDGQSSVTVGDPQSPMRTREG